MNYLEKIAAKLGRISKSPMQEPFQRQPETHYQEQWDTAQSTVHQQQYQQVEPPVLRQYNVEMGSPDNSVERNTLGQPEFYLYPPSFIAEHTVPGSQLHENPYAPKTQGKMKTDQPTQKENRDASIGSPEFPRQPSTSAISASHQINASETFNMHVHSQVEFDDMPISIYHEPDFPASNDSSAIVPLHKEKGDLDDDIKGFPSSHPTNATAWPAEQLSMGNVLPPININRLASPGVDEPDKGFHNAMNSYLSSTILGEIENSDDGTESPRTEKFKSKNEKYDKALKHFSRKPTCSLNLVCYRSGSAGCELEQVQVVAKSRYPDGSLYLKAVRANPKLLSTDEELFQAFRDVYQKKICSVWRRLFFLKSLRGLRLLSYTPNGRPSVVPFNSFILQEVYYAYQHPSKIDTDHVWIDWVFRLRQPDKRHALEFVEGWNGTRIAVAGIIPLIFSTLVGIIWSIRGGDAQTAFTVAGFILTAATLLLALLAVVSGVEASGRAIS